jgi:outer membrane receptor protein involved in Fe transport
VRYSTAAQRGGVNTFMDLIDPALVGSLEVLRGPNSAQYGSDALGGSLQFLSRVPSVGITGGNRFGGLASAFTTARIKASARTSTDRTRRRASD